jgi:hypothetical protein
MNFMNTNLQFFFTNISKLKKKTNFLLVQKGFVFQLRASEKIETNVTHYLVVKICRFVFGKTFRETFCEIIVACMNIEMRLQKCFGFIVLKRAPEQSLLFLVL